MTETAAEKEEVAAVEVETAVTSEPVAEAPRGRAGNDPRVNPQPLRELAIVTEHRDLGQLQPLDTAQPAAIEHKPRPLSRPTNDPRVARQPVQANDSVDNNSAEAS
ncbi:hypothetical protein [Microbulbifer taiwanensis]|uniref:hypothetical protein n=1 Tax=Microbulbifer taiwanensis TaxID=986746 RepID=UPI003A9465CC